MTSTNTYRVLQPRRMREREDGDQFAFETTVPRSSSSSSSSGSSVSEESRSSDLQRRAKFERLDSPMMELIEQGSAKLFDDQSVASSTFGNSRQNSVTELDQAWKGEHYGLRDEAPRRKKKRLLNEVDVEKYMARREMTPLQERVNAITVIPGAFYCLLFLLSGAWLEQEHKDRISDEMVDSQIQYTGEPGCISSAWFPHLHALPPLPVAAAAIGIIIHCPFSFLYHWHYAHRLPPGLPRTTHWSRRMDQAMIHVCSALFAYATSGSLDYFLVNLCYNLDCALRLFRKKVYPRRNQFRIFVSSVAYTIPLIRRGDFSIFFQIWFFFAISAWLFVQYPLGGWSHSAFHLVMAFTPPMLMASAMNLEISQDQLKVAARCAFFGTQLLDS